MDLVPKNPQRKRMVGILSHYPLESYQKKSGNVLSGELKWRADQGMFESRSDGRISLWHVRLGFTGWELSVTGQQTTRAILLLGLEGSSDSQKLLERLASGDKEGPANKAAIMQLKNLEDANQLPFDVEGCWESLKHRHGDDYIRAAMRMLDNPHQSVQFLKGKVHAIELNEMEFDTLLEELASHDVETWQTAYKEFRFLDPRIYADIEELMELVPENPARLRMIGLLSNWNLERLATAQSEYRQEEDIEYQISVGNNRGLFCAFGRTSWSTFDDVSRPEVLNSFLMPEWKRVAYAVAILEQIGTPEALEIIQNVADGSDRVAPTHFARKVLVRMKNK